MTGPELGFYALCCDLSDGLRPMTLPQLRQLRLRVQQVGPGWDPDRELTLQDIRGLGYDREGAERICALLSRRVQVEEYLALAKERGIFGLTVRSAGYPKQLAQRLGTNAPPVLFYKGDLSVLQAPTVALVGSRNLSDDGRRFSRLVGDLAAAEGRTLVSGNARGADQTAQRAALLGGGSVASVLADAMDGHELRGRKLLYLAEGAWHLPFSTQRALGRNRLIHALGDLTLVADAELAQGGTWRGTEENLRRGYSPVFVRRGDTPGLAGLARLGATEVDSAELFSLSALRPAQTSFWNQSPSNSSEP